MRYLLALCLSFLLCSSSWATVGVQRYPSGTPVQVCQPSDTNTNCGGAFAGLTGVTAPLSGAGTVASPLVISTAGTWSGNAATATNLAGAASLPSGTTLNGATIVTGTPWTGLYLPLGGGTLTGNLTVSGHNIITDTVTGTKIGTATNQLLGFFNASPVAQQTGNVCTALQNLGLVTSCTESGTTYTASDSVTLSGSNFTLTNDSASPTASQYYGTDAGSTLGYHALPSGAVSSVSSGGGTFDPTVSPTTGSVVDSANSYVKTLLAIEAANIGGGA